MAFDQSGMGAYQKPPHTPWAWAGDPQAATQQQRPFDYYEAYRQATMAQAAASKVPVTSQKSKGLNMKIDMGWVIVLAYFIGAFGSFGYIWNHSPGHDRCYMTDGVQHDCFTDNSDRTLISLTGGVFWPIYWGGIVAISTTK